MLFGNGRWDSKKHLINSNVLVRYDPEKELVLSCDACGELEEGSERPVAYPSRTLSKAEREFGHLDKEALAVGFAVKKFHQFLHGRHFKICTDHKPLLGLLHSEKATPLKASSRIQSWALTLLAYEYELLYRPGNENGNADGLSRLPVLDVPGSTPVPREHCTPPRNYQHQPSRWY